MKTKYKIIISSIIIFILVMVSLVYADHYFSGNLNVVGNGVFGGNLSVDNDITATNDITAARVYQTEEFPHMFGLVNVAQAVGTGSVWYNLTFNSSVSYIEGNLSFAGDEEITINEAGDYLIHYGVGIKDSAASPDANVAFRILKNNTQLLGSYFEVDTRKQNSDQWNSHLTYAAFAIGDTLKLQYISDDTTVSVDGDGTFDSGDMVKAYGYIERIH